MLEPIQMAESPFPTSILMDTAATTEFLGEAEAHCQ